MICYVVMWLIAWALSNIFWKAGYVHKIVPWTIIFGGFIIGILLALLIVLKEIHKPTEK